ncbi:MAG TPA: alpha/beta fold hydrolase, partial [Longimicrobiales bacterium]|nr:alpha/beta fold hydrolase [Longimicrobiales bacterium]
LTVGSAPFELPATLTMPRAAGEGPVPVVVLVHGSGPNDRDGTVGVKKPLRDLAWGLASRGVAVLRYEKRTRVHAARMDLANPTIEEETIADALAALQLVRTQPELDAERVFVLGHSLGAMVAPEIAVRDGQLAGVIMMAAGARPLAESMVHQLDHVAKQPENQVPQAAAQIAQLRAAAERIASKQAPPDDRSMGVPASYFYDLNVRAAPTRALEVDAPMLILQGERDYQVTMDDFAIWKRTLEGRNDVVLRSYPGLDHLFVSGDAPSTPRETMLAPGHVAQEVIEDVVELVKGE